MSSDNKKQNHLVAITVRVPHPLAERARLAKVRAGTRTSFQTLITNILDAGLPNLKLTEVKDRKAS